MADATLARGHVPPAEPAIPEGPDGREDPRAGRPLPPVPGAADPGHCSDHPGLLLLYPSRLNAFDARRQMLVCPSLDHSPYDRERCVYCGGALWTDGQAPWGQRARRTYCSSTCRNYLWRWRRRKFEQPDLLAELVP